MTDTSTQPTNSDQENKLTSAQFDEFKEALEVLYVIANLSARIQFAKNWPAAADFILGKDLMHYDEAGAAPEDKEDRAELEQEAEAKRIALLEFMDTLEEKSVEKGALQIEYVKEAMGKLGRPLSLLIYGEQLVDRFLPATPEEMKAEAEAGQDAAETSTPTPPDVSSVSSDTPPSVPDTLSSDIDESLTGDIAGAPNIHHDPMDDVRPIDFEESAPPKPTPSLDDQPVGADPNNPVVESAVPPVSDAPVAPPPMDGQAPIESSPMGGAPEVVPEASPSVPTLEETPASPMENPQAMGGNADSTPPMTPPETPPITPEEPQNNMPAQDVPPLTPPPPPPVSSPPPPPVQEQPTEMRPRGETPPPSSQDAAPSVPLTPPPSAPLSPPPAAPAAPVTPPPAGQGEDGLTQKPVAMKFVSSKDKTPDDSGNGDEGTSQG